MEVKAFKAYRYNSAAADDCGKCISPPYDVINEAGQEKLYRQSPYNIVRVIKGKLQKDDSQQKNQYTRAADYLNDWISKNVLIQEEKPAVYGYVQNFNIADENFCRSGFIALGKLAQFGSGVQPHEKTLDAPKADRLKLTMATAAQLGQIFMLFDDGEKIADKIIAKYAAEKKPVIDTTDDEGVRHRLFVINDQAEIDAITNMMADKQTLIADGHHRYETALNYYKQTQNPEAAFQMMTFVNMQNEGLVVLPTHRLVGRVENLNVAGIIEKLKSNFEITDYKFSRPDEKLQMKKLMLDKMKAAFEKDKNAFGIYDGEKFYFLELFNKSKVDELNVSEASKKLDVVILHKLILENCLGIGDEQLAGETNIEYIKDIGDATDEAIAKVDSKKMQLLFFMNPTKVEQVKDVAAANEKMPQKSTFFHPKIFTGLTINKL